METRHPSDQTQDVRQDRHRAVATPSRHDGIGNALRAAYDTGSYALPADFTTLLSQLDR